MSSFNKLFARYKTYDDSKGRGSVEEWRNFFNEKMSSSDALNLIKKEDPLKILGLDSTPTMHELKEVYRKLVMIHHPDRGGDPVYCKKVIAAFAILENKIK